MKAQRKVLEGGVVKICGDEYHHPALTLYKDMTVLVEIDWVGDPYASISKSGRVIVPRAARLATVHSPQQFTN